MRQRLAAFASALTLLAAATAGAEGAPIRVEREDASYDVRGSSAQALLDDARRRTGTPYFGDARWRVGWSYDYDRPDAETCRIRDLRITLVQRTTMPRWDTAQAPELAARWHAFVAALAAHEQGHQDHGLRAAEAIRDELPRLSAATCDALEQKADALGDAIIARHADLDAQYDARTGYGARQGAWWDTTPAPQPAPRR